jgi:hypothetical protein
MISTRKESPMIRALSLIFAASIMLTAGCREAVQPPLDQPREQDLRITFGGFLDGGDENQKIEGTCNTDDTRSVLTCDIYNGLPKWQITALIIRVTWAPYSQDNVRDFSERLTISPLTTGTVRFKLGKQLPADEVFSERRLSHWSWLVVGAKARPISG